MKNWLIGGTVATLLGVGFYLVAAKRPTPAPAAAVPEVAASSLPQASEPPAVLDRLVDVSDLDSLLDPPAVPRSEPETSGLMLTGFGYEESAPASNSPFEVKPIPRAKTEGETIRTEPIGWYGNGRLPRQIGIQDSLERVLDRHHDEIPRSHPRYQLIGLYF